MRVAICLSGHVRTFKYCYKSLLSNVLDNCDDIIYDIFAFTNNNEEAKFLELIPITKKILLDKNDIPFFDESKYKYGWSRTGCRVKYTIAGILEQYWKIEQCFKLMEQYSINNNIKYDLVIKSRFDLFYFNKINVSLKEMDNNIMYLGHSVSRRKHEPMARVISDKDYKFSYSTYTPKGFQDHFAVSNINNMSIYSNKYSRVDWHAKFGGVIHPEENLYHFLNLSNIPIKFLYPLYNILREDNISKEQIKCEFVTNYPLDLTYSAKNISEEQATEKFITHIDNKYP